MRHFLPQAGFATLLRGLLAVAALAMALSGAVVFESTNASERGLNAAQAAVREPDLNLRGRKLLRAGEIIEHSWARPAAWHPGAQEALSWTYAALATQFPRSDFGAESIAMAQRSLTRAPVQPAPWARLALFDAEGQGNALCDAHTCLERSWEAVEMTPLDTYCLRLRLGHDLGLVGGPGDPRIVQLTKMRVAADAMQECVSFLTAPEIVQIMLVREAEALDRYKRERQTGRQPSRYYN